MPFPRSGLPTLVVDSDGAAATRLAEHLRHEGFEADIATSFESARRAMLARLYGVIVVVAALRLKPNLECLAQLRRTAARTWMIVISLESDPEAQHLAFQHGADSLLTTPFSIEELTFRLSAFSHRSRPL
jgi:DNA-binding response OmpR family regulator